MKHTLLSPGLLLKLEIIFMELAHISTQYRTTDKNMASHETKHNRKPSDTQRRKYKIVPKRFKEK